MAHVFLNLFWHHHQPYYVDALTGVASLPWVRLHGIKDYFGMAAVLERHPEVRCTFNMVPALVEQIQGYADGTIRDRAFLAAEKDPSGLTAEEAEYVAANFFRANPTTMIAPYARYHELWRRREDARRRNEPLARLFRPDELRDLQVWHNLAWFHPLAVDRDPELQELRRKGRAFTEDEKRRILGKEIEILAGIVPQYRRLRERGQVELTTSPYFHPILPLLCDMEDARAALPQVTLPHNHLRNAEDARWHLREAVASHERHFGVRPAGLWPSEGSVSEAILPLLREAGIRWFGTDEEILAHSSNRWIARDGSGDVQDPDFLYRPYRMPGENGDLAGVFRDHALSDLLGFHYQRMDPAAAADDLVARLERIGRRAPSAPLVSVILDGENAWEYYANEGLPFFDRLYGRLARHPSIRTVRVSDHLEANPPDRALDRLFPGSWIDHSFYTWIGHSEDRRGWEAVYRVRADLVAARGTVPPEAEARAWRALYAAEGSDWYWWFGDDRSSEEDELFDRLFRRHLMAVYGALGREAPRFLETPIKATGAKPAAFIRPRDLVQATLDGRVTSYFEWLFAGRYVREQDRGVMDRSSPDVVEEIHFGSGDNRIWIRIDLRRDPPRGAASGPLAVELVFQAPKPVRLRVDGLPPERRRTAPGQAPERRPVVRLDADGAPAGDPVGEAVAAETIEIAVPYRNLDFRENDVVEFFAVFRREGEVLDQAPLSGALVFEILPEGADRVVW